MPWGQEEVHGGHREKGEQSHGGAEEGRKIQTVQCYNCQKLGTHLSRKCPKQKGLHCMWCGQFGHMRFAYSRRPTEEAAGKL